MSKKIIISLVIFLLVLALALIVLKQVKVDNKDKNFIINNSGDVNLENNNNSLKHSWAWDIN